MDWQDYMIQAMVAAPLVVAATEYFTIPIGVKGGEGIVARKRINSIIWAIFFNALVWVLGYLQLVSVVAPEAIWMRILVLIGISFVTALGSMGFVDIKKNWGRKGKVKLGKLPN